VINSPGAILVRNSSIDILQHCDTALNEEYLERVEGLLVIVDRLL
jgi:hypothetical protein